MSTIQNILNNSIGNLTYKEFKKSDLFDEALKKSAESIIAKLERASHKEKYQAKDPSHPWSFEEFQKEKYLSQYEKYLSQHPMQKCIVKCTNLFKKLFKLEQRPEEPQPESSFSPILYSLLNHSKNRPSAETKSFLNRSFQFKDKSVNLLPDDGGICRGECHWINYLFFASKKFFNKNNEEALLFLLSKQFIKGGSIEPCLLQKTKKIFAQNMSSSYELSIFTKKHLDEKAFLNALNDIPNGSYQLFLLPYHKSSGHDIWFIKRNNIFYVYDPNPGLLKVDGVENFRDFLSALNFLHDYKDIYFKFILQEGYSDNFLKQRGSRHSWKNYEQPSPGIYKITNYYIIFNSNNIFIKIANYLLNFMLGLISFYIHIFDYKFSYISDITTFNNSSNPK